jgi:hypothetical protein
LASLAKSIADSHDIQYINSLLESDLLHGLLWYVESDRRYVTEYVHNRKKNQATDIIVDCPSWTWVACWGSRMRYWSDRIKSTRVELVVIEGKDISHDRRLLVKKQGPSLESTRQDPQAEYAFQQITTRALTLTGYINTGIVNYHLFELEDKTERWPEFEWSYELLDPGTPDLLDPASLDWRGHVVFDFHSLPHHVEHITYIACVGAIDDGFAADVTSLALEPTDVPGNTDLDLPEGRMAGFHKATITLV